MHDICHQPSILASDIYHNKLHYSFAPNQWKLGCSSFNGRMGIFPEFYNTMSYDIYLGLFGNLQNVRGVLATWIEEILRFRVDGSE